MDIGTGKDMADYTVGDYTVPCHLIDICEPGYKYNVYEYQRDFRLAYDAIRSRGRMAVLCGGTGMYMEAVIRGFRLLDVPPDAALRQDLQGRSLDELVAILASRKTLHNKTDVDTAQRAIRAIEIEEYYARQTPAATAYLPLRSLNIGIDIDRDARRDRITARLHSRIKEGMIDEVRRLLDEGVPPDDLIYYGLEYKYLTLYITGRLAYDDMLSQLEIAIHQFAKRQMTWFRGMERRGCRIHWIKAALPTDEKIALTLSLLSTP
jgi:tRNA dimethylallyltransferase